VAIGVAAMLLNIALSLGLAPLFRAIGWQPHGGLALANTLATTLEMAALLWWMRKRLGGLNLGRIWPSLWRMGLATALMSAALVVWLEAAGGLSAWITAPVGVALGGLVYWGAAFALRVPEARALPMLALGRLLRRGREA
jgi:putative peptidoglycan lipid II flippase